MRTPDALATEFRARGLKMTPQRHLLFGMLYEDRSHPSAEDLHHRAVSTMPGISLRTVYQTLGDLVAMGELRSVDLAGGATRFDPNTGEHHHLVCDRCGDLRDVYLAGVERVAPTHDLDGFAVTGADIILRGTCSSCSVAAASAAEHTNTGQRHR